MLSAQFVLGGFCRYEKELIEVVIKHWLRIVWGVCVILALASCEGVSPRVTITATSTGISHSTSSPAPSLTLLAPATQKPTTTSTQRPIPSPTKTFRPLATPTATPTKTDDSQAEAEIKSLFQDNEICPPPCYLGVVPGQTTSDELRNIFAHWGIALQVSAQNAPAFAIGHQFNSGYWLGAKFLMNQNVVESIGFSVEQDEPHEWAAYSPIALLQQYGPPSHVSFWIGSIHEPSSTPWKGWYYMIMSYDELELNIEYGGVEIRLDEMATICPYTDAYDYGRVWLGKYPDFLSSAHVTYLEDATSITLEEFHDYLMKGPGACFYLDVSKVAHL